MPGGYRIGPKLPLREEHSQDSSRKEHAMEKRLATPQKARNAGLPTRWGRAASGP